MVLTLSIDRHHLTPLRVGFHEALNTTIYERWTDWGRCYTIKAHASKKHPRIYLHLNHSTTEKIGVVKELILKSASKCHSFPGLFITEEPLILGLRSKWVAPVTTAWLRNREFNDFVLTKRKIIKYAKGMNHCNGSSTAHDQLQCSHRYIMDEYMKANCSNREFGARCMQELDYNIDF